MEGTSLVKPSASFIEVVPATSSRIASARYIQVIVVFLEMIERIRKRRPATARGRESHRHRIHRDKQTPDTHSSARSARILHPRFSPQGARCEATAFLD